MQVINRKIHTTDKCLKILRKLVKIDTTHPLGNEMNIIKAIIKIFFKFNLEYKVLDHGANRGSLVLNIPGKIDAQTIAFVGHVDTVPIEEDFSSWRYPPFGAVVDDHGYMYGRGTVDMKGGCTAMILTALYFLENEIIPPIGLKFCFTADEEATGIGVTSMRESGYLDDVKEFFISEPSENKLGIAEKGALWLKISTSGKASHGSKPDLGINAAEKLINYIDELKQVIDFETEHKLLGRTTLAITQFFSGMATNCIPVNSKATLDIRTIPAFSHQYIIKEAERIATEMQASEPGLKIKIEVKNNRPALEIDPNHQLIKKLKAVYKDLALQDQHKGLFFYTDASQIVPQLKRPFVILGPGDDALAHQKNERIKLTDVIDTANIYINYILNYN